jgi:hypothetical protein
MPEPQVKPFSDWLDEQRRGATHAELSKAMAEVVAAVAQTNKPGTLTLKIKIKPSGDGMVMIEDEINDKAPEPDRSASLYFYGDDGSLYRDDPKQGHFDLRQVEDDEHNERKVREIK